MMYSTLPIVSGDGRRTEEQKRAALVRLWGLSFAGNLVASVGFAYAASVAFPLDPNHGEGEGASASRTVTCAEWCADLRCCPEW